jgi:hypothetical protein
MVTKQISNERLKAHIETLGNAGELNAPPGSRPWAIAVRLELQSALHDAAFNAQQLKAWRDLMKQFSGYHQLVDDRGQPFKTYEELCKAKPPFGLGYEPSDIDKIIQELASPNAKTFEPEEDQFQEQGSSSKYLEKFSKLVQACPDQQPINAVKIKRVLRTCLSNAHRWRKWWLDLGWIEALSGNKRGYYQITDRGRKQVKDWLEKVPSSSLNTSSYLKIPRHNSKRAAEALIKDLDSEQLREIYSLIGESLAIENNP